MRYSTNVDKLLNYKTVEWLEKWPNYLELGLVKDDIPALLKLALDEELFLDEDEPLASAPYHAWRTLGQLQAEEAILPLLRAIDDENEESDNNFFTDEGIKILGLIGEKAVPHLESYLRSTADEFNKGVVVEALGKIAKHHPECREHCVALLTDHLAQITTPKSHLASFIVCALIDVDARESIDTIRAAFAHDSIQISIPGDLEEVEIALGFRTKRATPKPNYHSDMPGFEEMLTRLLKADKPKNTAKPEKRNNIQSIVKPIQVIKVGRNDPCPCGSGKKYKKCCLQ